MRSYKSFVISFFNIIYNMHKLLSLYKIEKNKYYSYKKKKFRYSFLKNFDKFKKLWSFFSIIRIDRFKKNIFLNFSNFLDCSVLYKVSIGLFFKRSLKKTYYALETILKNFTLPSNLLNVKKFFFLNVKAFSYLRGFKRLFKNYLKITSKKIRIRAVKNLSFRSHNGMRKRHRKRK